MSHEVKIRQFEDRDRLEHVYSWDCSCELQGEGLFSEKVGAVQDAAIHVLAEFLNDIGGGFDLEDIDIRESTE